MRSNVISRFCVFLYLIYSFSGGLADGACTFPGDILGSWVRGSDNKTLTFSSSSVSGLNITFSAVHMDTFNCVASTGTKYVIRYSFNQNAIDQYAFLCFDLQKKSDNVYFLHILTVISNQEILDQRQTEPYSIESVCNKATDEVAHTTLVKSGATNIAILCPSLLFGSYNYTVDSTLCPGDSRLDVCIDRKSIIVNYTMCSEIVGYSAMGEMDCIGHVVKGNTTYLSVYIRDTTATYRTTCFAIEKMDNQIFMTSRQVDCVVNQSPTSISAPGRSFKMIPIVTCPFTDESQVVVIVAVVVSLLIVAAVIGALLVYFLVLKKRKPKTAPVAASPSSPTNKPVSPGDVETTNAVTETTPSPAAATNGHVMPLKDENTLL
ncbi:uncharacterized protein LOC121376083 [Gigantopelta aegis]|uniref:uncharacterized protein LOC121376083 n=1 Tax=Gigantopelta aegis TaxID=1735272 RepID=UPI001B88812A|nr:uncharacterized protein LOC121376083 [Gigantopelta aegis]